MEWIIISLSKKHAEADAIASFLSSSGVSSRIFETDTLASSAEAACDFCAVLEEATHCIVPGDLCVRDEFPYIAGFCAGRDIPLFVVGGEIPDVWYAGNIRFFDDIGAFEQSVTDRMDNFVAEDTAKSARAVLYRNGIPLTANCYAGYVAEGNIEKVSLMIDAGMDINTRDSEGTPPLCTAARNDQNEMALWLVNHGADIDAISVDRGYSAVMDAVWKNNYELAKTLVEAGSNLNFVSNDGQTALILAVGAGNEPMCELLASNGADVLTKDHMGMSALSYAKLFRKESLVSLFMSQKA